MRTVSLMWSSFHCEFRFQPWPSMEIFDTKRRKKETGVNYLIDFFFGFFFSEVSFLYFLVSLFFFLFFWLQLKLQIQVFSHCCWQDHYFSGDTFPKTFRHDYKISHFLSTTFFFLRSIIQYRIHFLSKMMNLRRSI